MQPKDDIDKIVTSLAEVWIEIVISSKQIVGTCVTSLAEVWIEIVFVILHFLQPCCHFPCGSVD